MYVHPTHRVVYFHTIHNGEVCEVAEPVWKSLGSRANSLHTFKTAFAIVHFRCSKINQIPKPVPTDAVYWTCWSSTSSFTLLLRNITCTQLYHLLKYWHLKLNVKCSCFVVDFLLVYISTHVYLSWFSCYRHLDSLSFGQNYIAQPTQNWFTSP